MQTIIRARHYEIKSAFNGAQYIIVRLTDGKSVSLQGDDAAQFSRDLDATTHLYTDDDLCAEYDEVMM
jgi:hypothetical protein